MVDLSVIVKIIGKQTNKEFKEFATNVCKHIMSLSVKFKTERINIVADQYYENSLKGDARKDRGTRSPFVFNDETKFRNFSKIAKTRMTLISI